MKRVHLFGIGIIAIAIMVIITSMRKDLTTYTSFEEARSSGDKVKLVGQLVKEQGVEYNPEKDPNYMSFFLKDEKGEVRQIVLRASKPQDFERSEQIVLTGEMNGEVFNASDMLLKCPSKYNEQDTYIQAKEG